MARHQESSGARIKLFQLEDIPAIELGNKDFKILVITDIH